MPYSHLNAFFLYRCNIYMLFDGIDARSILFVESYI